MKTALDAAFHSDSENGKPVENALHGVWLGHPLHPVLTDIAIGAWTTACVFDLIDDFGFSKNLRTGADGSILLGITGAAAAAAAGLTDWKEIDQGARRTGLLHGLLNSVALGLFVTSSILRAQRDRSRAKLFSYAGFGVMIGSAWLGGHLSFSNQIGVARVPAQEPPEDFTAVLPASQLEENKPRRVEANGYPLVLVKRGEQILALAEMCTHAGGPLSEGRLEGDCIRCPWHGSLFDMRDGSVVESPSVHAVACFDTRVQNGQIEVRAKS